jgi:PKD repeat protein
LLCGNKQRYGAIRQWEVQEMIKRTPAVWMVTVLGFTLVMGLSAFAARASAQSPDSPLLKKLIFSITAEPDDGTAPLTVKFGVDLYDDDLQKPKFLWNFGDGESAKTKEPVHVFKKPGEYKVTLRVEDTGERAGSDDTTIVVEKKE